jgi:hypothetical protein
MKILMAFILSILILLQISCNRSDSVNPKIVIPVYYDMANQLNSEIIKGLSKRFNMNAVGITAGLADHVNVLGAMFQIRGPLSKDELRQILVDCVQEYLQQLNSNEKIRPFLKNYPFLAEDINISILVVDKKGLCVKHPAFCIVANSGKTVWFATNEPGGAYKYEEEETFEESLKIVTEQNKKT